ncbi:hypothetical protein Ahy_A03g011076 [Arachis hypogaea]|uniref:Aminotransferase-like plant mobile domain-containing protein n=1 Tax=Arachis hypogaea TaxID=3818 RepID=A0A445DPH9_ARAHY|nr:hypothetical protein Ahy_A03g011076 [Arachis hypogaea]
MVRDYTKPEDHIIEYLDHPQFAIINLLPRKLDPPDTFNEVAASTLALTGDTEPCDTQESLERYVRAHIFCVLDTIVFPDKSTVSLNSKFLPLLRDFPRISGYSWGAASLAHLYRSLCRASQYNCKKMDGPLILLFVWAWERMPFLAPIPRDQLGNIVGIPDGLAPHMVMCSTQSPLMSFECIEWHATDRVRRQFGMQQLLPGPAFDLGCDHCKRLTGAQNHEWGQIYSQWVNRWTSDRYNTLQLGEEIIDFHPLPVYYDWYTQQYEIHLRLSDRVLGEEVGADEPQQQQEEPADSHQEVPAYEHHYQVPEYEHQFQDPAYAQQFQDPAYVQQFQDPAYAQQWPTYHGRRATSGHTSDFDFDHSTGHVDLPGPSAPPRGQLFDLNEYLQQEEGDLGYDLQHWYDLGGSSAPGMSGIGLYDTGCASMTDFDSGPDVDSGLDAGVSQGHPYNLRTQTAPSNKYTPSLYSKKVPRK